MDISKTIDKQISDIKDWRGDLLSNLRKLILTTDKNLKEEYKWGVPVYSNNGLVCAISAFKDHVKMNFFKGAFLKDKHEVLNGGLDSKQHRSIDFSEDYEINEKAIKDLLIQAIEYNKK